MPNKSDQPANTQAASPGRLARLAERAKTFALKAWAYWDGGVWQDTRGSLWVRLVKVVNLTVRGFLDGDLQSKACAMTYRTILALVPGLALLLAIGRGFGLQDYIVNELYSYLPSQKRLLQMVFTFVDSYLSQASEGIFVGVGIVFLLWTLVSLLSSVEDVFNSIFNIKRSRSWWRKLSDYTAILLILPVLMICASGISIFMTTALHRLFDFTFLTPVVGWAIDFAGYFLSWLFFAGSFLLIPNTKVKALNAFVAGVVAGTAFQVLQWLFMSGQMYVTKYNAIYGSFSFLPLMLIWLQLVWLITFICAGICYSSQNVFRYSFEGRVKNISLGYRLRVDVAVLALVVGRFARSETPVDSHTLTSVYSLPPRLVEESVGRLIACGLVCYATTETPEEPDAEALALQPTGNLDGYTLVAVLDRIARQGDSAFIPGFDKRFAAVDRVFDTLLKASSAAPDADIQLASLAIG